MANQGTIKNQSKKQPEKLSHKTESIKRIPGKQKRITGSKKQKNKKHKRTNPLIKGRNQAKKEQLKGNN